MSLTIATNNHARELFALADLSDKERTDFDYIDEEEHFNPRLFKYRGAWHDVREFARVVKRSNALGPGFEHRVDDDSPLLAWQGIQTDSYFSGVVIRYVDDCERVVVGLALS